MKNTEMPTRPQEQSTKSESGNASSLPNSHFSIPVPTLTPKLRFPEFRDAPAWETKIGDDLFTDRKENGEDGLPIYSVTINDGMVPRASFDRDFYDIEESAGNKKACKGDIAYNMMRMWQGAQGVAPEDCMVSPAYVVLKPRTGVCPDFFAYLFKLPQSLRLLTATSRGLTKDRLRLYFVDFARMRLRVPKSKEQHCIADCLSSLDDLIAAERQKLDALKAHKKGLMQHLFPREGETRPRLRFPEFRKSPEWSKTPLGKLGKLVSGLTYSPDDVRDDGLLVLRSSNIQDGRINLGDCVFVDPAIKGANISKPDDILICVRNGSKTLIGKNAVIPGGLPVCTHGAFMTVFRTPAAKFVSQMFQTRAYQKQVAADLGATINSINGSQLLRYKFYVPEQPEQHRIASCLSSLDDLIAAQADKLEALTIHKKGLMQGLFLQETGGEK